MDIGTNKKRKGRPATGKNPGLACRIPRGLFDRVVEYQNNNFIRRRADAVAELLEKGLERGQV
jgi:hypothetical protein